MALALEDLVIRRRGELSKVLAGCALVDPIQVIPLIGNLSPVDLQDERAKKFLTILQDTYLEIQGAEEPIEFVAALAIQNGFGLVYLEWLALACEVLTPSYELACEIVTELQKLAISVMVINELKDYARELTLKYGWGDYDTRTRNAEQYRRDL